MLPYICPIFSAPIHQLDAFGPRLSTPLAIMAERRPRVSRRLRLEPYPSTDDDRHLIHNILDESDSEDLDDAEEDVDDPTLYQEDLEGDLQRSDEESSESDIGDNEDTGNADLGEEAIVFGRGAGERSATRD